MGFPIPVRYWLKTLLMCCCRFQVCLLVAGPGWLYLAGMARMDTVPTHQLHVLMQNLLNLQEQQTLLEVLQDYSTSRDVHSLVYSLKTLLDTPAKCQLVTLLRRFINKKDGATFDELFPGYDNGSISSGKLDRSVDVTSIPSPNASLNRRPRSRRPNSRRSHPLDLPAWEAPGLGQTRNIVIDLGHGGSQPHGLGFSIRGGAEHGIGVYVSYVDVNSIAEKEGLVPGDQLLYVNGVSFRKIAHSDAAKVSQPSPGTNALHILRPTQNRCYFADCIFQWIFLDENLSILIQISLMFILLGPVYNKS